MMVAKFLEKSVGVITGKKDKENRFDIELKYYLIESETDECQSDPDGYMVEGEKVYGIEITRSDPADKTVQTDRCSIMQYSTNREDTLRIIDILARNTVTPLTLHWVMDDLLGA